MLFFIGCGMLVRDLFRRKGAVLSLLALLLFAWLVWPTRYHYEHMGTSHMLVRVDRLTGETDVLTPDGWFVVPGR